MRENIATLVLSAVLCLGITSLRPESSSADIKIYPEKSQSAETEPEPLTLPRMQKLLLQDVTCAATRMNVDAKVDTFQISKCELRNRVYYVLGRYAVDGKPVMSLATVSVNPHLKRWCVSTRSSRTLEPSRGFSVIPLYTVDNRKMLIGGYVNNPQMVQLNVRVTQPGRLATKVIEVPVDEKRYVFKFIREVGQVQIDGLDKDHHVLYGWG